MSIAIQIQNLSKAYQLGQIGTGTISKDGGQVLGGKKIRF
jgi:hypothetical protein